MASDTAKLPSPPGLIASLARGFDSVATHILVILPPLLFDLFLWLGPRLDLASWRQRLVNLVTLQTQGFPTDQAADIVRRSNEYLQGFNLFSLLRTVPLGTSSLLSFKSPVQSPLGVSSTLQSGAAPGLLGWIFCLIFLGWIMGAVYFYWVSGVALQPEARSLWKAMRQCVLLAALLLGGLFFFGIPALYMLTVLAMISPGMTFVVTVAAGVMLIWLAMPVFFSPHGIFTFQLDAFRAILSSLRMARFTLPTTAAFLLVFAVMSQGLNFLWNTPPRDSWWTLVGIAGHAFISTALLAASFVYYRDVNVWLQAVLEHLQKQNISARA
jgi:hypothetical protein